jgi:hypothetical protein
MATWRMRIACWRPKVENTVSERVILIAFPLQQWLHERAILLRYMYISCLVYIKLLTVYQPNTVLTSMCNVHCWFSYHYTYVHGNNVLYNCNFCNSRHYQLTICRWVMSTYSIGATCGAVMRIVDRSCTKHISKPVQYIALLVIYRECVI